MKSLIFLDIDGVINSQENIINQHNAGKSTLCDKILFPEKVLLRLKKIVDKTGAGIIISSTWRKDNDAMKNINKQFSKYGITVIGKTSTSGLDRGAQILDYLSNYNKIPYIVIDDEICDIKNYIPELNIIKTDRFVGLTDCDCDNAISRLLDFYNT